MTARVGNYLLCETLGTGAFGKVRQAVHEKTGKHYAIKIMDKSAIRDLKFTTNVRREIAIMKALDHPNIVSLHQVLTSPSKLYVVLDLVRGPELFQIIQQSGNTGLSESKARKYFQHLIEGVSYCHQRGVCHRDLKPENLLIDEHGMLKITDFGLSSMKGADTSTQLLTTQCGTPHYIAPEIISRSNPLYDGKKVDAWACGIILFALLAGYLPFDETDLALLFDTIRNGRIKFPPWISSGARDLIWRLLCVDPEIRMSVHQVKQHPWFLVNYFPTVFKTGQVERAFPNRFRTPDPLPAMKKSTKSKTTRRQNRIHDHPEPKSLPIRIDVPTLDLPNFDTSSVSKAKRDLAKRKAISRRVREMDSVEPKSMPTNTEAQKLDIPTLQVPPISSPNRSNYAFSKPYRTRRRVRESPEPQSLPLKTEIPSLELPILQPSKTESQNEQNSKQKDETRSKSKKQLRSSASQVSVEAAETAVGELVRLKRGMSFSKKFSLVRKGAVQYGTFQLGTFCRGVAATFSGETDSKLRIISNEIESLAEQQPKEEYKNYSQSDDEEDLADGTPSNKQTMCAIRSLQTVIAVSRSHFKKEDSREEQNDISSSELTRDSILAALRRVRNKLMEIENQFENGIHGSKTQQEGHKFLSKSQRRDTIRLLNVWESIMLNDSQFPERIDDNTALTEEEMWAFQSLLRTWEGQLAGNELVEEVLIPGSVDIDEEHLADNVLKEFKDHQEFLRAIGDRRRATDLTNEKTNKSLRAFVDSPISFESSRSSSCDQTESFSYSKYSKRLTSRIQKISDSSSPCTPHYGANDGPLSLGNLPSNNSKEISSELRCNDLCDVWNQVLIANTSKLDDNGNPELLSQLEEDEGQKDKPDRLGTTEISEERSIPTLNDPWSSPTLSHESQITASGSLRAQIDKNNTNSRHTYGKKGNKLTRNFRSRAGPKTSSTLTTESITPRTPQSLKWDPIHDLDYYEHRVPSLRNRRATSAFAETPSTPETPKLVRTVARRSVLTDSIPKPKRGKRGGGLRRWTVMGTDYDDERKHNENENEEFFDEGDDSYLHTLRSTAGFASIRTGSSFRGTVGQSRSSREHKRLREPFMSRLFNIRGRYLVRFESQYDSRTCLRELGALLKRSGFDVACKHGERKLRVSMIGNDGEKQRIVSLEFRSRDEGCTVFIRKASSGWGRNRREEEGVLGQFCAHTVHNFKRTRPGVAVVERPRWNRSTGTRRL